MSRSPVVFHVNWSACIQCGACVGVCPKEAGFTSPFDTIATETPCDIACMACEKICPVTAIDSHRAAAEESRA